MTEARRLNRLWTKGQKARVIRTLTAGGKLNTKLLALMLEANRNMAADAFRCAFLALA